MPPLTRARPPAARKEIVEGSLGIVRDVLAAFPSASVEFRDKVVNNLLVTLTSAQDHQNEVRSR